MEPFSCPRCRRDVEADYYGPCQTCRAELRDALGGETRALDAPRYEPKMNVTPNAVATKE